MAWNVSHKLESVDFTLYLPRPDEWADVSIKAVGRASTRRAALWVYQETFNDELDAVKGYGPADAIHHIGLVAMQDRPNTLERLNFALSGGLSWCQDELPGL